MKNRSHLYDINRPRLRHGHEYTKCKMYLSIIMVICIKQHLSKIWSSVHEKVSNTEAELKKNVAYRNRRSHRRCSLKKGVLKNFANSQESTCVRVSFLIKLQAGPAFLLKKRLWHMCFPVNFAKFLRTPSFKEHLRWLLL